jgi:hypothetical protein
LVFIRDRLVSGDQIDDAQAARAQHGVTIRVIAVIIRSPMIESLTHPPENEFIQRFLIMK